ncbi:MAG: hypothetical protein GFH27_549279n337 [Chloroflexi bacterium AL-W]|nr:hypothetical protein [Chloroflexi bacterium AL-N1]NOK65303.1 hypothetical protein [Chloroflexi bacterium AL-N10]NOK72432.1 hypothetical protein [Chloroflexi bacterium AL-N5]NOK79482.1 hypothetical protein [Chloroflexi bacterium AL-W]NOK87398.1 hypothetical protein [Chloroflexi bacterium AL-N15]
MMILIIFVGCGVSITQAQNQNPPDVTDPNNHSSVAVPVAPESMPRELPVDNQILNPTIAAGVPSTTADIADANEANQVLALLAAGTGLAAGVGLARGGVPMAQTVPTQPFTWPPWAQTVSHQIINQQPIFWQRLLQSPTRQVWLTIDSRLEVRDKVIMHQRIDNGRILAEHSIATIQPGGINFHWEQETQDETDEDIITITVVGNRDEALLEDLASIRDPYERFLLVQEQRPDLITDQAYPTSEIGQNAHIVMENPLTQIVQGSKVDYGFNLGNVLYDSDDPPSIRSFVINDPRLTDQWGVPTYVRGPDGRWEDAHWTIPGTHTLVYEVQYSDQLPQYYTLEQTVVEPHELAAQRLQESSTPLNAEMYLLSLQTMLQEVEQQEGIDADRLEQFRASVQNATTLLESGGTPIQAVLVADETSQAIPLTLFLQQTEDGYAIVDLTNPHPDAARTYQGNTIEAAWQDFLRNNTLPSGQIAATPPSGAAAPSDDIWNSHSDGQSTLERWSNGLGVLSLVALGAGVVLMFVPGGQIPGGYIIGAMGVSIGAGALASGLSMADRAHYGNLTWNTQTQLELLDLAGSLLVGGTLVRAGTRLTVRQVGQMGVALEILETGTDVTSAILLTREYYDQIETIRNSDLSELQKQEAIREVLQSAAQLGGLVVLGVGLSRVDFNRIRGAVNMPNVSSGLRDAVNASPTLQQILASQNYDASNLSGLWLQWRNIQGHIPFTSFDTWVASLVQRGISLDVVNSFFLNRGVVDAVNRDPSLGQRLMEHPEFMRLALADPLMMQRLLERPGVSPTIPVVPSDWRRAVSQFNQPRIEYFAQRYGLTVPQYQAAVNIHFQDLINQAGVYKRVRLAHLESILQDGRFRTLFETGTSGGTTSIPHRNNTEVSAIGFDEARQPVEHRPQYGYLSQDPNGLGPQVAQYGDVTVVLRPEVRERSTFTFGDSLDATQAGTMTTLTPQPLDTPTYEAFDYNFGGAPYYGGNPNGVDPLTITSLDTFDPYVEVQIHGGLQVSDIQELIFDSAPPSHIVTELNRLGVTWRVAP